MAKIEANEIHLNIETIELERAVEECTSVAKSLSGADELEIKTKYECESPFEFQTDPTRFKQILINLVSNAVKYNVLGGSVTILCQQQSNKYLRISVFDTGIGIAEEDFNSLFHVFNRLNGNSQISKEGAGIGLYVTKMLI